jgi:hypothetical protein
MRFSFRAVLALLEPVGAAKSGTVQHVHTFLPFLASMAAANMASDVRKTALRVIKEVLITCFLLICF